MIPVKNTLLTVTSGALASADYEISIEDQEHIMELLRDGLYSDKILAILREYGSNAWDAHRMVGKADLPIKVTLPTYEDDTLRIRDYGPGLSHADVFNVFNKYGKSTKRGTNNSVGCLGIGSKSGFAYADSFTITSWHDGVKRIYVATKYEDEATGKEKSRTDLFAEIPCDPSETGVEISIATKPEDRYEFERTARRLFQHMTPRPEINIGLPALADERTVLTNGVITPSEGEWVAVMGCVPYRINLQQLDPRQISKCLPNLSGILTFDIGAVAMNASREELKYTTATKNALVEKFNALVDEFVTHALQQLEAGVFTGWETRLRVQVLAKLDLPLPEKWKPFAEGFAKITYTPDDFVIIHNKAACTRLFVTEDTCLLIDDTGKELSGYYFDNNDYVVRSAFKAPEVLRADLDAVLAASGLTGVKIELLSARRWTAPVVPVKKKTNPKHRARMFKLIDARQFSAPWSDNWTPELRIPTKDDVYVVIESFKAKDYGSFFSDYAEDAYLAAELGATMPVVYGYKTTDKRPVDTSTIEGTPYRAWRKQFIAALLTPERIKQIARFWMRNPLSRSSHVASGKDLEWLKGTLGDNHPICVLFDEAHAARAVDVATNEQAIRKLAERGGEAYSFEKSTAHATYQALAKRYPLLRRTGFSDLWHVPYYQEDKTIRNEWVEYVKMCDERIERANAPTNVVHLKSVP